MSRRQGRGTREVAVDGFDVVVLGTGAAGLTAALAAAAAGTAPGAVPVGAHAEALA